LLVVYELHYFNFYFNLDNDIYIFINHFIFVMYFFAISPLSDCKNYVKQIFEIIYWDLPLRPVVALISVLTTQIL